MAGSKSEYVQKNSLKGGSMIDKDILKQLENLKSFTIFSKKKRICYD